MNITFRGIGYTPNDEDRAFLDKKLQKVSFAEDYLHDLDIAVKKEAKGIGFHIDAILHFVWRKEKVVSIDCYELYEGIEKIADKIQSVAKKEKELVKDNWPGKKLSRGGRLPSFSFHKLRAIFPDFLHYPVPNFFIVIEIDIVDKICVPDCFFYAIFCIFQSTIDDFFIPVAPTLTKHL